MDTHMKKKHHVQTVLIRNMHIYDTHLHSLAVTHYVLLTMDFITHTIHLNVLYHHILHSRPDLLKNEKRHYISVSYTVSILIKAHHSDKY